MKAHILSLFPRRRRSPPVAAALFSRHARYLRSSQHGAESPQKVLENKPECKKHTAPRHNPR